VKFGSYVEREMVRNLSKRLKGTNFGISPHYPPEVLEKRKKEKVNTRYAKRATGE
jgi:hypothetical protein